MPVRDARVRYLHSTCSPRRRRHIGERTPRWHLRGPQPSDSAASPCSAASAYLLSELFSANRTDDVGAGHACELAGEMADAAGRTVDQPLLPDEQATFLQRLERGQSGDGQRRRLLNGDGRGYLGDRAGPNGDNTPSKSHPGRQPSAGWVMARRTSPRFRENASTLTSASEAPGVGSSTSARTKVSLPLDRVTTALMSRTS